MELQEPDEDLAAKFAADLCANERLVQDDEYVDVTATERPRQTKSTAAPVPDQQRFNPRLTEGQWAPDLTLMYPPNFTAEVFNSFRKK